MSTTALPAQPRRIKLPVAAEQYGVSIKTLRRRIADGSLTGYRLGSRIIVVDLDELEALFRPITAENGGDHGAA